MRATLASLTLCLLVAACGKSKADSKLPEPQAGPGNDSCAVYVERVATGVRCQAIDSAHCSCELVAAATPPPGDGSLLPTDGAAPQTPPTDPGPGVAPAGSAATLAFAPGPANTTVTCIGGPCPVRTAEVITAPYPAIAAAPSGTQIQLEFKAPDHKPFTNTYTVYPGTNQIPFTLEKETIAKPDSATIQFQGAPAGATVECVSGPCQDHKKSYPVDGTFPPIKLDADDQTLLLRFNAPGYRTTVSSYKISRGANILPVLLDRKQPGK